MHISVFYRHAAGVMSVIALAVVLLWGCENPVEEHEDEHSEAHGLAIVENGTELLRVVERVPSDTLQVPLGDTTAILEVQFLDEDGNTIRAEDLEENYEAELTTGDASVVEVITDEALSFRLRGLEADTASVMIGLLHLPQRHYDLHPVDVPVLVR